VNAASYRAAEIADIRQTRLICSSDSSEVLDCNQAVHISFNSESANAILSISLELRSAKIMALVVSVFRWMLTINTTSVATTAIPETISAISANLCNFSFTVAAANRWRKVRVSVA
jgi:hypothetical protein